MSMVFIDMKNVMADVIGGPKEMVERCLGCDED
jgi:hypothetical protein